jgi:pyruvate/2-oxoglutarate/acetoin dehydrogenase E1 component
MVTYLQSLQSNLHRLMEQEPAVYILGEDILDPYGGAFKVTKGLSTHFPNRVITTPISEAGIVGIANGMALRGLKPIVEIMFGDFITLAADQIVNYAAKFSAMYQKEQPGSIIVRLAVGAGRGYGPTHSQSLEKMFLGIPHLELVAPSHFHDPGQVLYDIASNIHNPVLFLEHKLLYTRPLVQTDNDLEIESLSSQDHCPVIRLRNYPQWQIPDVTLIAYGGSSLWVHEILKRMRHEEIRVLALLPSRIKPLDMEPVLNAVRESGRLIILEEGTGQWGWGAEIAASVHLHLWDNLRSPVRRIGAAGTIVPAAKPLEDAYLPSVAKIEQVVYEVLL